MLGTYLLSSRFLHWELREAGCCAIMISMKEQNNYSLGLDIGTTSIGWALIDFTTQQIKKIGVRKFNEPVIPKTGTSLTEERRGFRALRRNIRRKSHRKTRLLQLFRQRSLINTIQYESSRSNKKDTHNIFYIDNSETHKDVWQLRAEGLERKLDTLEWARVIFHISKHRGYESNARDRESLKEKKAKKENGHW